MIIKKTKFIDFLYIFILTILIISCSPIIDNNKFANLYRAAKSIEAAISIGVNYSVYSDLLQKYSTELLIIKRENMTPEELKLFNLHKDALVIFLDAQKIWAKKIESPKYKWIPENNIFPLVGITSIIAKYNIKIDEIKDSTGKKWATISSDSIQFLWSKAESKIAEADEWTLQNKSNNSAKKYITKIFIYFPSLTWKTDKL